VSVHIGFDELADAAAGLLDAARAAQIHTHLSDCEQCTVRASGLNQVTELLASEPPPTMPAGVSVRLEQVLAAEGRRRSAVAEAGPSTLVSPRIKPGLGNFGDDLARHPRRLFLRSALGACLLAGAIGFAGYFVSASAGMNEPPATAPAVVSSSELGPEASSVLKRADLSAHRFSQAWQCARDVTDGRITAITAAVVDGTPALLVYTEHEKTTEVTVVKGCGTGSPFAGPSTALPR
jgi:hypothetical protein